MSLFQILFANMAFGEKMAVLVPYIIAALVVIFLILPIHECAHGLVAHWFGDDTAKRQGRLTINPLPSIDPLGALFLLLFGFGWAKPVLVDTRNFKHPRVAMAVTALAGPLSNLLCALIGTVIYFGVSVGTNGTAPGWVFDFLGSYVRINVGIAVFNMIPLPPLDGSKILGAFLSDKARAWYYKYQFVFMMLVFVLMFTSLLDRPLYFLINGCMGGVEWLASRPFVWAGALQ